MKQLQIRSQNETGIIPVSLNYENNIYTDLSVGHASQADSITGNFELTGDVTVDKGSTYSIGTEDKKLKAVYADEVHISQNTLYIDGIPVLGTESDTITIKADKDQSLLMKTQGEGLTQITSEKGVSVSATGANASITFTAAGTNSTVSFAADKNLNLSAANISLNGTTTIANLNVTGTTTTVNSNNLTVKDNVIEINSGETGSGVTAGTAGIKVNRGEELPYLIEFDESDDLFKLGMQGNLETVATRPYVDNIASAKQDASTAINTGNISSQSVSYADSAGSVAWNDVNDHPTAVSSFTNDAGYLTSHQDISGKANTSGTYSGLSVGYATSAGSAPADGGNADTVDSLHVASGRNNSANQIVRTDGQGYIQCGYINSSSGNEKNNSNPTYVWGTNGSDDYMRTYNTSYLSVNYATSAGSADSATTAKSADYATTAGTANSAYYADFAEFFPRGEETEIGDIIALDLESDKEQYIKATEDSVVVVGVHSEGFGISTGGEAPDKNGYTREEFLEYNLPNYIPIGLAGRVPVKFIGAATKGTAVVPSNIAGVGRAFKAGLDDSSKIVGYLLETDDITDVSTSGIRLLKILIKK